MNNTTMSSFSWQETFSALLFLLYSLLRDFINATCTVLFHDKETVYYAPTHAVRHDDRVVFTFDRREVLLTILRAQFKELVSRVTQWRWRSGVEGTVVKDASVFGVVKFANKWNQRKNEALSFGKIWFTNGTTLFVLFMLGFLLQFSIFGHVATTVGQ